MWKVVLVLNFILFFGNVDCQLIRPNNVYEKVITGIRGYYNNTCIILLHSTPDPINTQGMEDSKNLVQLQTYLSKLHIRTAIMEIANFLTKVGGSYYHIKRPLFVLLNDDKDTRIQFSQEIATWIDMSYPTWLIFFRDENNIDDFFKGIYIQFDCTFMVSERDPYNDGEIITEVYQVDKGQELRRNKFATWNAASGIETSRYSLYQRRNDLFGHTFRVMSIEDPPQSMITRKKTDGTIELGGFFGGVIELLKETMNCSVVYQENVEWGYKLENGSWSGMIGSLIDNSTDIVAAELMMTADRLDAIKFTTPAYSTKCRTFIKQPSTSPIKWGVFFAPFSDSVWGAIGLSVIVTSAIISFTKSLMLKLCKKIAEQDDTPSALTDIFLEVFGSLCGQGMQVSSLDPIRMIHSVIHLCGMVVLAAYSAALISSLAVKVFVMPFTTMEGLLNDGTYRFGVVGASADFSFFQNTSDEILDVLFSKILVKEKELPGNYIVGLKKVCTEDKYAFMTMDNAVAQLQSSVDCTLVPLDTISQTSIGMGLRPGSPYRGIIDNSLLLLRDSGLLQRLLNSDWALTGDNVESSWSTVEILDILPLVVVLVGGWFFSFCTFFSERMFWVKKNSRNGKKVINKLKTKISGRTKFKSREWNKFESQSHGYK